MAAPVWISRENFQGMGQGRDFGPLDQSMTTQAVGRFGQALQGVGQVASQAAQIFDQVNRATTLADRQTQLMTGLDQAEQEFRLDPDPTTAPQRYQERAEELRRQASEGLRPEDAAELNLRATRMTLSSVNGVRQQQLGRQADQFSANMDAQFEGYQRRYVAAGSDAERAGIAQEWDGVLSGGVRQGVMTAQRATAYQQSLTRTGDDALITRRIAQNPVLALNELNDPAKFAGLDAPTRERYRIQAQAARDELAQQALTQQARWNPTAAVATIGRINGPEQVAQIVERGIIPQESGGNPNAISVQGAQGIGQIMPDTARTLGARVGRPDLADMPEAQLRETLRSDVALNRRLAAAHIEEGLRMTDGSLFAAIAGYHGGNGWAAGVHRQAVERFGPTYSAEQFASLIPDSKKDGAGKRTSEYLLDVVRRLGGATGGTGMTASRQWAAQNAVAGEIASQQAVMSRQEQALISVAKAEAPGLADVLNNGYATDPQRLAAVRAPLTLGAARGDAAAAQQLRQLDEAAEAAPIVAQAYRMAPDALQGELGSLRQQMAAGRDVTPAIMRRLRLFEGVANEISRATREDSIGLAIRSGIAPNTPLPAPDALDGDAGRDALARRSAAFDMARRVYGGPGHFFRPDEASAFKARFDEADAGGKARMLKGLADGTSAEAFSRAVTQIAGDNPTMELAGRLARSDLKTAQDIVRGQQLLAGKGVPDPKITELRAALAARVAGDLFPGEHQGAVVNAALALYAAERGQSWALYDKDDRAGLERALERAAGGPIARINNAPVVLPRGVTEPQFRQAMQLIEPSDLGGSPVGVDMIRRFGQFRRLSFDGGTYAIVIRQGAQERVVADAMGLPVTIDMGAKLRDPRAALGAPMRGVSDREQQARDRDNAYRARMGLPLRQPGEALR